MNRVGWDNVNGEVSLTLHAGDSLVAADDVTWSPVTGSSYSHLVVYGEFRVRDWRWLWLRRKTVVRVLGSQEVEL